MKFITKYKELGDESWLREHYLDKKLSLNQIAELVGCKYGGVRNAIVRKNIPLRSRGEGLRNNPNEDFFVFDKSVVEGALLGDGSLKKQNKESADSYPVFCKGNKNYDHVLYVANLLFSKNAKDRIGESNSESDFGKSNMFRLSSLTHSELIPLFLDWYPESNGYEKLVPESIEITASVLLHWFLDDGYSYWITAKKKYRYLRVQFATQSFQKDELDLLSEKINAIFGLKFYPRLHERHGEIKGSGYFMELSQAQNMDFFDVIGPCPTEIPSMAYKWKLP